MHIVDKHVDPGIMIMIQAAFIRKRSGINKILKCTKSKNSCVMS